MKRKKSRTILIFFFCFIVVFSPILTISSSVFGGSETKEWYLPDLNSLSEGDWAAAFQQMRKSQINFRVESVEEFKAITKYYDGRIRDGIEVHRFRLKNGESIQCILIHTQGSLSVPGRQQNNVQFAPNIGPVEAAPAAPQSAPIDITKYFGLDGLPDEDGNTKACPEGSFPRLMPKLENLYRFNKLGDIYKKYPPKPIPPLQILNGPASENLGTRNAATEIEGTNSAQPITLTCPINPAQLGVAYTASLVATGGVPPYTFSISSGTLPPGLTLNPSSGTITGTPTTVGTFNFTAKIVDSTSSATGTHEMSCSLTIPEGHEHATASRWVDNTGSEAYFNIWSPYVEQSTEFSLSQLWVLGGTGNNLQSVEIGWQVCNLIYSDNNPHLFIYFNTNNYTQRGDYLGCYNMDCIGFVQTNSNVVIGGPISPISAIGGDQNGLKLGYYRDAAGDHNWWLKIGDNWAGYYPNSLFNSQGIANQSDIIEYGGEIVNNATDGLHTTTNMGSGRFPSEGWEYAAYTSRLKYVDMNGILQDSSGVVRVVEAPSYYDLELYSSTDSNWLQYFYFGGPGRVIFSDVLPDYWAYVYITAIYNAHITVGCSQNPLQYCPSENVTRDQMAAFLVRATQVKAGQGPENYTCNGGVAGASVACASTTPYFLDVLPATDSFFPYIQKLKELGITTGCGNGDYCPSENVTRDQMAAFLIRALYGQNYTCNGGVAGASVACASTTPYFSDVLPTYPSEAVFYPYIQKLKELGITTGGGNGDYCPSENVTRDQMAAFLGRAFLGMQ